MTEHNSARALRTRDRWDSHVNANFSIASFCCKLLELILNSHVSCLPSLVCCPSIVDDISAVEMDCEVPVVDLPAVANGIGDVMH